MTKIIINNKLIKLIADRNKILYCIVDKQYYSEVIVNKDRESYFIET